jgi:hypothetical protein
MILTKKSIQYFQSINSRVLKSMAKHQSKTPFHYEDEIFFAQYECLRSIWKSELPIKNACQKHNISKSSYYEIEKRFIANGLPGLFLFLNSCQQHLDLEQLALLIKKDSTSAFLHFDSPHCSSGTNYRKFFFKKSYIKNPSVSWLWYF